MIDQNAEIGATSSSSSSTSQVLLYDGVCGVCNKTVQTILSHDRTGTMRFAALQSEYGQAALARHPELKSIDSVIFLEPSATPGDEHVYSRSTAALKVASYLGGAWKLFLLAYIIPRPVRDALYDFVARHRYKIFGKHESCMLPPPGARARFLDV